MVDREREMGDVRQPYCIDTPYGSITAYLTLGYSASLEEDEAQESFQNKIIDFQLSNPDITDILVDDDGTMEAMSLMEQQDLPDIEENLPDPETCKTQEDITASFKWTPAATKFLIEQIRLKENLMSSGRLTKRKMFQEIAANINKEMNLNLTEIQVSNRYKTLMRSYKQVVDNNKKTGSAKKTHAYENELGELLKDNPNIRPVHTLSSSALVESSSEGKSSLTPSPPSSESSSRASSPDNPVSFRKKTPASTSTSADNTSNASEETPDSDPPPPKKGTKRQAPSFELSTYLNEESAKQEKRFKEFLSKMETMHKEKLEMFRDIFGQKK